MGTFRNPFQKVRVKKPKMSLFDLSHEHKLSGTMAYLYPALLQEVLPGDRWQINTEIFMKVMPMIAPLMHRVNVYLHYFFVPNRLVWENWETFITGDYDGTDASTLPQCLVDNSSKSYFAKGKLSDYFGIAALDSGTTYTNSMYLNFLPFRGYVKIFNEYYGDPELQYDLTDYTGDSVTTTERNLHTALQLRCWEKDYFTSCNPQPQLGSDVTIDVDVDYLKPNIARKSADDTVIVGAVDNDININSSGQLNDETGDDLLYIDNISGVEMDLDEFRYSMRLKQFLEKNARAGSRYVEQLLAHFGVKSPDARMQRPEYLGGIAQPVTISEVLNTSDTASADQGNMSGHGMSVGASSPIRKTFTEHGYIHGILSVLPRTGYHQGVPRTFLRNDKFDFAWPEFAHIGEQAVKLNELYVDTDLGDETDFGYQQRFAEYKYNNDQISGDFHDDLDHWSLHRDFAAAPSLNANFIASNDEDRFLAVQDGSDYLIFQLYHNIRAIRALPYHGDPRM